VYHVGGGSLPYGNSRKTFLNFRNNLWMLFKNLPASQLFPLILFRLILDGVAGVYSVLKNRNFNDASAILKAHWAFFSEIPNLLQKRKLIPNKQSSFLYPQSIIWAHFVKGKKHFSDL